MNTFWLKVAAVVVVIAGVIILFNVFLSRVDLQPKEPAKTIYDQWEEDERKLTAEPQFKEPPKTTSPVQPKDTEQKIESPKPQFKKLSLEDELQAQQLWEWVRNQRKMGRLPVMGYKRMVDTCREIMRRWPESEYAFYAKRALADLPERYRKMYNITEEEIDLGDLK